MDYALYESEFYELLRKEFRREVVGASELGFVGLLGFVGCVYRSGLPHGKRLITSVCVVKRT